MQAVTFTGTRQLEVVDIPAPSSPGPGEVTVRTHRVGICGTDYSSYLGKFPFFDYPRIPGHELGVEVVAVGEGVDHLHVGQRCSVEPYMNCGDCYACKNELTNCCTNLKVIGVMVDGGLCESFNIRADKLHPSQSLEFDQLALVETLAIGCHAIERAQPTAGSRVLIIGAGPIGLATLEFAVLADAKVTMMDIAESRLEFCQRHYNIDSTVLAGDTDTNIDRLAETSDNELYPVVVDATGNSQSMAAAVRYLAPGGKLVFVGISTQNLDFPHPVFHKPEATLMASRNALPHNFRDIINLMENGKIETGKWITHRSSLNSLESDMQEYVQPGASVIKAVIGLS